MSFQFLRDLGHDTCIRMECLPRPPVPQRLRQTNLARSRARKMSRRCDGVPLSSPKQITDA
jgi:hypothetical protein